jgi:hypothetical protein
MVHLQGSISRLAGAEESGKIQRPFATKRALPIDLRRDGYGFDAHPAEQPIGCGLADYTGGLIVVRERKGSRPWCSLAPADLRERAAALASQRRAKGMSFTA